MTQYLAGKPEWEKREVGVIIPNLEDPEGINVTYFYNQEKILLSFPAH
ncbi:hypothetical protein [Legionella parisiensis]|nr:hypothetical protein [Legionella parisiensis]